MQPEQQYNINPDLKAFATGSKSSPTATPQQDPAWNWNQFADTVGNVASNIWGNKAAQNTTNIQQGPTSRSNWAGLIALSLVGIVVVFMLVKALK